MKTRITNFQTISEAGQQPVVYQIEFKNLRRPKTHKLKIEISNVPMLHKMFKQLQGDIDQRRVIKSPKQYVKKLEYDINTFEK